MKSLYQHETVSVGSDCRIYRLYKIMEWDHKYIVLCCKRVRGWSDDDSAFVCPKLFDTIEEAHDAMVKLKQENGDYEG